MKKWLLICLLAIALFFAHGYINSDSIAFTGDVTITFDYQDDKGTITCFSANSSLQLAVPEREDYIFDGWYTDINGMGEKLTEEDLNQIAKKTGDDLIVHANWLSPSEGLSFTQVQGGYAVGLGTCKDTVIVIPDTYQGLPVITTVRLGFVSSNIQKVYLSANTISVGQQSFIDCQSLTEVYMPDTVYKFELCAFMYCSSLNYISNLENVKYLDTSALALTGLEHIVLTNLEGLGIDAFGFNDKLKTVSIEGTLTEIPERTFMACPNLTEVRLPPTIEKIDYIAFYGCTSLQKVNLSESLKYIGESAFQFCNKLTITLPKSVEHIDAYAFASSGFSGNLVLDNISYLGEGAFARSKIQSVKITSNNLTRIHMAAFAYCATLKTVELPKSLVRLGSYAFIECTGLTEITIPESVEILGDYAFYQCTNLTKVVMSDKLTNIGENTFTGCTNLKK